MNNEQARLRELELQLKAITDNFEREMRARGFDPSQAENTALPTHLARLSLERQLLIEEIEQIQRGDDQ